jgi:hypothetical protein
VTIYKHAVLFAPWEAEGLGTQGEGVPPQPFAPNDTTWTAAALPAGLAAAETAFQINVFPALKREASARENLVKAGLAVHFLLVTIPQEKRACPRQARA